MVPLTHTMVAQDSLQGDNRLRLVKGIALVVDKPTQDDRECGLSDEPMRLELARPLLDAKVRVTGDGFGLEHNLSAEYLTIRPDGSCVTSLLLELSTNVSGQMLIGVLEEKAGMPARESMWGNLQIWKQLVLVSTGGDGHRDRVLSEARRLATELATKIRLAQQ